MSNCVSSCGNKVLTLYVLLLSSNHHEKTVTDIQKNLSKLDPIVYIEITNMKDLFRKLRFIACAHG